VSDIKTHPVQTECCHRSGVIPRKVYLAAYEVYAAVYGPQQALIEGGCRGGFGVGETIALLYARAFPREEWRARVDEALTGLRLNKR